MLIPVSPIFDLTCKVLRLSSSYLVIIFFHTYVYAILQRRSKDRKSLATRQFQISSRLTICNCEVGMAASPLVYCIASAWGMSNWFTVAFKNCGYASCCCIGNRFPSVALFREGACCTTYGDVCNGWFSKLWCWCESRKGVSTGKEDIPSDIICCNRDPSIAFRFSIVNGTRNEIQDNVHDDFVTARYSFYALNESISWYFKTSKQTAQRDFPLK